MTTKLPPVHPGEILLEDFIKSRSLLRNERWYLAATAGAL